MKTRDVDFITSNEGLVRMRIFDGDLGVDAAAAELIRMERAQHEATKRQLEAVKAELAAVRRRGTVA